MMKHYHKKRLLKLAEHLETLKPENFDFAVYQRLRKDNDPSCGTVGCAIGEMPRVWPRLFKYELEVSGVTVVCRNKKDKFGRLEACLEAYDYFGINGFEYGHLFVPTCQCPRDFGGEELLSDATPKAVAKNIRAFLKRKEKGKC